MVTSRFAAGAGTSAGFRTQAAIDDSPEGLRQTRLAVARAKEGDRDAQRFLYAQYSHNVYGYVRSIVRDDHEAEDVTQHVFAKLLTAIVKYDDRGVPFFAWLIRLARNVAIDHLRAQRSTPTEVVVDPDRECGRDLDQVLTVRAVLADLPDDQREVVILRHVVGLSPGEIASRMGRTGGFDPRTAPSRTSRAAAGAGEAELGAGDDGVERLQAASGDPHERRRGVDFCAWSNRVRLDWKLRLCCGVVLKP